MMKQTNVTETNSENRSQNMTEVISRNHFESPENGEGVYEGFVLSGSELEVLGEAREEGDRS